MKSTFYGHEDVGYIGPQGDYFQVTETVYVDGKGARTMTQSAVPDGSTKVPVRPGPEYVWSGKRWDLKPATVLVEVPHEIGRRQFFQLLALDDVISKDEALAAVKTGDLPAAIEAFINSLDEERKFGARMLFAGSNTFERGHPLVEAFGVNLAMAPEQLDDLWVRASKLK